jgi:hypothetical protein
MSVDSFYSRFPLWILWISIVSAAANAWFDLRSFVRDGASLDQLGRLHLLSVACAIFLFAFFASARRHRLHSPTVEVSDDEIAYGLVFRFFFPRNRVAMDEIVEILPSKPNRVELRMRSGKRVKIPLMEVARSERAAVREAIEERLARRNAS